MSSYECGCKGTFIYQKDTFDDYFNCIMEVYKCDRCGYIWHKIKE
ncbi:MAG TPA: hypothetical protein VMV43_04075 [Candidatus Nanopelagicaceae bacterium]|nr:hypothetical protein [Candidatus Nanopelagicaceae bacterium]